MENKELGRIAYIDIARGFAIFLVILGHTLTVGELRSFIYSFHMPLFFMISGMTLKEKNPNEKWRDFLAIIKKRASSYYIPYLMWGLFYTTLNLTNFLKLLWGTYKMLHKIHALSSLWFLPALLVASILSEFAMQLLKNTNCSWAIFIVSFLFFLIGFIMPPIKRYGWPFGLNIGFTAAGFMLWGYLLKKILAKFSMMPEQSAIIVASMLFAVLFHLKYKIIPICSVSMHVGRYDNIALFLINALLGSITVISVAICIDKVFPKTTLLQYIGQNTLGILVLHKPIVQYLGNRALERGYPNDTLYVTFGIALIGGVISLMLTAVITKLAPILVGKNS